MIFHTLIVPREVRAPQSKALSHHVNLKIIRKTNMETLEQITRNCVFCGKLKDGLQGAKPAGDRI